MVLAVSEDEDALFEAITAGAAAFILKDDLVTIVMRVSIGEYLVDDQVFAKPAVVGRVVKKRHASGRSAARGAAPIVISSAWPDAGC
jgi:DNA-binding NarL/FixJ family response regulator